MQFLSKISPHKYILAILGLAFVLRFVGIWYGLPSFYNSDEPFNVINSLAYGAKKRLEKFDKLWLRHHLFERGNFSYQSGRLSTRYSETNWLGEKYIRYLDGIQPHQRLAEMRRFRELNYPLKMQYIRMLPG